MTSAPDPRLLMKLESSYKILTDLRELSIRILENAAVHNPDLKEAYVKLTEADQQLREMLMTRAEKSVPVNVGGEGVLLNDMLDSTDSSSFQVRRIQAKRLAKRLYSLHHPDKGGSPAMFNTIKQAVNAGDLETLLFFRVRDGVETYNDDEVKSLIAKIEVRVQEFKGRPGFHLVQLYHSNMDMFVSKFKEVLTKKTSDIQMQMFGMTVQKDSQ